MAGQRRDLPRTVEQNGHTFTVERGTKRASLLSCAGDVLADGTIVLRTSHQRDWFYVRGITPDGRFVRRRYRHKQLVAVEVWTLAPKTPKKKEH
jgi:hypothetical protein